MKILYRQSSGSCGSLEKFGINDCYYKNLIVAQDRNVTTKIHHHTGFELHIITNGFQIYQVGEHNVSLPSGMLLLIPPKMPHRVIHSEADTEKISITFSHSPETKVNWLHLPTPITISETISFISAESESCRASSRVLIENRILEAILIILRLAGMAEAEAPSIAEENSALTLSKQYIADNIERNPSVAEVSQYCCVSSKQLTRIYNSREGMSPGAYIIQQRAGHIERLLTQGNLSLQEISNCMNFSSEYYFNVFFKKYIGMPPGAYRKMHGVKT